MKVVLGCFQYPSKPIKTRNSASWGLHVCCRFILGKTSSCSASKHLTHTLPQTNIGPKNEWLEYYFPIGEAYFQGRTVSFRAGYQFLMVFCKGLVALAHLLF